MSNDFTITGFDELQDELKQAVKAYPDKAAQTLKNLGNRFKRETIKKTDECIKHEITGKIKKGYKVDKVTGYGINMQVNFRATAPHFHLLEHGHNLVTHSGQTIGFIPGYHMVEQERKIFAPLVPAELDKMIKKIAKECDLD